MCERRGWRVRVLGRDGRGDMQGCISGRVFQPTGEVCGFWTAGGCMRSSCDDTPAWLLLVYFEYQNFKKIFAFQPVTSESCFLSCGSTVNKKESR